MRDPLAEFDEQFPSRNSGPGNSPWDVPPDVANVAVVFVHGMGEQTSGDMLASYMNPCLEWIKRSFGNDHHAFRHNDLHENLLEGVNILERELSADLLLSTSANPTIPGEWLDIDRIERGVLKTAQTSIQNFQPPYLDVLFRTRKAIPTDDSQPIVKEITRSTRLVAVEAWWAKEIDPPPFRDVAAWGLGVLPTIMMRMIALMWGRDGGKDADSLASGIDFKEESGISRLIRYGKAALFTLVFAVLGIAVQWLICALMIFSPIPFLQKYVSKIVLRLTTSLGDVLVYVHDGVKSIAIRSTVHRSIQWLINNYSVEKLIIVAHSLGSVISYDILATKDLVKTRDGTKAITDEDVTFVTFGSPLKKVNLILDLMRDEQRIALGMLFAVLSFFCAVMAAVMKGYHDLFWPFQQDDPVVPMGLFVVPVCLGMYLLGIGVHAKPSFGRLSIAQWLGVVLNFTALIVGGVIVYHVWNNGWLAAIIAGACICIFCAAHVRSDRGVYTHMAGRMSGTLSFGLLMIALVVLIGVTGYLSGWLCFLMLAIMCSILTGSNPIEEFRLDSAGTGEYQRQMPHFSFATPVKRWIDFWATNDAAAEYGLNDVEVSSDGAAMAGVESRRVTNNNSYFTDHQSYIRNTEQFIVPLTHLFIEKLGYPANPGTPPTGVNWAKSILGVTPVIPKNDILYTPLERYGANVANVMRSRAARFQWLGAASMLLVSTFILLSPTVARSIGEYIVFSQKEVTAIVGPVASSTEVVESSREPLKACEKGAEVQDNKCVPPWFAKFYSVNYQGCPGDSCTLRIPPFVPEDFAKSAMDNRVVRTVVLYGLGYGVLLGIASALRIMILQTPWRAWESAILDRLLQLNLSRGRNCMLRGTVFWIACIGVFTFAFLANFGDRLPFSDEKRIPLSWIAANDLSPWDTLQTLLSILR